MLPPLEVPDLMKAPDVLKDVPENTTWSCYLRSSVYGTFTYVYHTNLTKFIGKYTIYIESLGIEFWHLPWLKSQEVMRILS